MTYKDGVARCEGCNLSNFQHESTQTESKVRSPYANKDAVEDIFVDRKRNKVVVVSRYPLKKLEKDEVPDLTIDASKADFVRYRLYELIKLERRYGRDQLRKQRQDYMDDDD